MNKDIPNHAVKAVIRNQAGEILFLQRNPAKGAEPNWDLPGGIVEIGEDDRTALAREIKEELGVEATVRNEFGKWRFYRPYDGKTVDVTNYATTLSSFDVTLSDEHIGYKWVAPSDAKNLPVKDQSIFTALQPEFPYQIVTFLNKEPAFNETIYSGEHGWYPQLALKRRFKLQGIDEESFISELKEYFSHIEPTITTGALVKPERMPVRVVEIMNADELKELHLKFIHDFKDKIISRYPERDGENYLPHITAEYNDEFVIPFEEYINREFPMTNVWLVKDNNDENSIAFVKLK